MWYLFIVLSDYAIAIFVMVGFLGVEKIALKLMCIQLLLVA